MNHRPQAASPPRRVVIVGAGFAGVHAARRLTRLPGHRVEVTLINGGAVPLSAAAASASRDLAAVSGGAA
jgi:glycine/D-amino acid oxidase-like deaminating enzyme